MNHASGYNSPTEGAISMARTGGPSTNHNYSSVFTVLTKVPPLRRAEQSLEIYMRKVVDISVSNVSTVAESIQDGLSIQCLHTSVFMGIRYYHLCKFPSLKSLRLPLL